MLKASRKGDEEDAAEADVPGVSGGTTGPDGLLVDEDGVIIE
jgi:hypothetical protein